jgi:hypothetical protein
MFVLKDSLHGSKGQARAFYATFGRGSNGYPGFKWMRGDAFSGFEED